MRRIFVIIAFILTTALGMSGCTDTKKVQTDYPSALIWNNTCYFTSVKTVPQEELGEQIGEIKKQVKPMPKNSGEANFLPVGTKLYEIKDQDSKEAIAVREGNEYRWAIINKQAVQNDEDAAKQVVLEFFQWYQKKDAAKMESLMIKGRRGIVWDLDKMEYIKLLKLETDTSDNMKNSYMNTGGGKSLKPVDVKVFKAEFDIKFKGGFGSGMEDGRYGWYYIVIKENEGSPWLVADWGY